MVFTGGPITPVPTKAKDLKSGDRIGIGKEGVSGALVYVSSVVLGGVYCTVRVTEYKYPFIIDQNEEVTVFVDG